MLGSENAQVSTPVPLLFLVSDTGGGHRAAAQAVSQALARTYPGRFAPVLCDPLGGPGSARLLRWVTGLYGPAIRLAPWLWGAAYHVSNSRPALWLLQRVLFRLADGPASDAAGKHRPAAIVSFHPLTGMAAVAARDLRAAGVPVVTVITDLARTHAAWRCARADLVIAAGPPVTREYWGGPLDPRERAILRRTLGISEDRFLVVLSGGGEGTGGIGRRAAAILGAFPDADIVAVCGRNARLKGRLDRLAVRSGGRLTVTGFTPNMADLLRCCDLVVTKAGPGTIAEATCCGAPMLLTSHLPGQETGNTELVTRAAAGRGVPRVRALLAEIGRLRADPGALDAMRSAAARMSQPAAAANIAAAIARQVVRKGPATPARWRRDDSTTEPAIRPAREGA